MNRSSESIAREVIAGQFDEIQGYTNPVSDNMLSAWSMALDRAERMVLTLRAVCDEIAARPMPSRCACGDDCVHPSHATGNDALRAICDEPPFSEEPFVDQIRKTIAARKIAVETPEEAEALDQIEARQVDLARPEVFDIVGFTQTYFNKGA